MPYVYNYFSFIFRFFFQQKNVEVIQCSCFMPFTLLHTSYQRNCVTFLCVVHLCLTCHFPLEELLFEGCGCASLVPIAPQIAWMCLTGLLCDVQTRM